MGLFKKRTETPTGQPGTAPLGSGRRLRSSLSGLDCLSALNEIVGSYRQPTYEHLPLVIEPGWAWTGVDEDPPTQAVSCGDQNDDFLLIALWPQPQGTNLGLFPLGGGDDRLSGLPIVGHWKQRDSSLSSIGLVPSGRIRLAAPVLAENYCSEILQAGGYPDTESNREATCGLVNQMMLVKAHSFLSTGDSQAADRFVDGHRWIPGSGIQGPQSILSGVCVAMPGVLPYIQDLPLRVRAILLDNQGEGSFWHDLDR
jgi:hypothetical protein